MAFPTLTAQNPTADSSTGGAAASGSTLATSHSVGLPATVNAGDLLLVFGRVAFPDTVAVSEGGWSIGQSSVDASNDVIFWGYRDALADGTEDGSSITVTHGSSKMVAYTMAIAGAEDPAIQVPQASTIASGTSTTPDPTTVTPTGGAKDYLWIWFGGWEGEQTLSKTAPINYTDQPDISTGTAGAVTNNCQIKTARRTNNAASEDPGSVTISASDDWMAWTIAIHPAGTGVTGTLAETQDNQTLAASGSALNGSLAETQDNQTLVAAGVLIYSGSLAETQADQTLAASGTVAQPPVSGTLAETQADQTLVATGWIEIEGSLVEIQANQTLAASGVLGYAGTLAETQDNQTLVASGWISILGTLAETQANQTLVASGFIGEFETPAERILIVTVESRELRIAEDRTRIIEAEDRRLVAR